MTIVYRGPLNVPNITCLSSDVSGGTIAGAQPGMTVFYTDTAAWKIVKSDLTLADYVLPVDITLAGELEIGKVVIKDDTAATTATVGANGLAVDAYINHIEQPVADAIHVAPFYGTQSVATPGTAEPLLAVATYALSVIAFPKPANIGNIYFGTSTVDKTASKQIILGSGSCVAIDAPLGYKIDIHNYYIDADNGTDGVNFMYLK